MPDKSDKLLLITGASKGIGRATAACFAAQGYRVINVSRTLCDVAGVRNFSIDLANSGWPDQYAQPLLDEVGSPQKLVLVHNAAMMTKDSVSNLAASKLREVLDLNVVVPAQLNSLFIPKMQSGSSIIYISSTLGRKAVANTHAYVVSKHAVVGQMRATCQDLTGSQIHTACICPGFTETEMLKEHLGKNPEVENQIIAGVALGRLVRPDEIADAIWFCSQNPVINGALIDANLGQIEH